MYTDPPRETEHEDGFWVVTLHSMFVTGKKAEEGDLRIHKSGEPILLDIIQYRYTLYIQYWKQPENLTVSYSS